MMHNIQDRLRAVRKETGLSQDELAIKTGSKRTTVAGYESGISLPHAEFLTSLTLNYGINSNWLLTGEGEMYITGVQSQKSLLEQGLDETIAAHPKFSEIENRLSALETLLRESKQSSENPSNNKEALYTSESEPAYGEYESEEDCEETDVSEIPYVHDIAAGPPIAQSEDMSDTVLVPCHLMKKGRRYYAASIRGTSMTEAGIHDGDIILIRCENVPRDNAIQVVQYDGKSTLKLLKQNEGNGWELHYRDGTGQIINCQSNDYKTQGEFEAVLPKTIVSKK